ncbi:serine/threonine-protein kinase [Fimbriiglobus ruber]|uniref:Putative signal transduction protein n=1 Tax=Fimbriiglobus ruber TaxID=1908690 RepID=A0A225D9G4_9BACT|nr:serine/threonine-protein kinase [Fimbriiglobus ruber]OWK38201.1 putative signal transduction protein [Fimbriiglobus ruber]
MPPPASTADLLDRVRRSGLIPQPELASFVGELGSSSPSVSPPDVLDRLVTARLLTPFQAERIAAGKYKGFRLGSYVILDRIGGGAMGQVYLAEHADMRRMVAIKVMIAPGTDETVTRERFFREARAAAALNHPNIIRLFDLNREGRLLYLVAEYYEGLTLSHLIARAGRMSVGAAVDYARQIACGLQHAADQGIVHRDIKPSNLFLTRDGTVKILDLGLVRSEAEEDSKLTSQLSGHPILGTADYLAPEQAIDCSSVDARADVYSLGASLYFLLAGAPMFPEGRVAQKLMWHQWRDPTPIQELRPDVPDALAEVVSVAIRKKREKRFQSPGEMVDALSAVVSAGFVPPGPFPPPPRLIAVPPPRRWATTREGDSKPTRVGGATGNSVRTTPVPSQATRSPTDLNQTPPANGVLHFAPIGPPRASIRPVHDQPLPAPADVSAANSEPPTRPVAVTAPASSYSVKLAFAAGLLAALFLVAAGIAVWKLVV